MSKNNKKLAKLLQLFIHKNVAVDGQLISRVSLADVTGFGENEVVLLAWKEKGVPFEVKLTEDGLINADLTEYQLELEDHEGEPITITFTNRAGKPIRLT